MSGRKTQTAERILDAAEALFCARGFSAVSAQEIAARAGVPKALLFYHFKTMGSVLERVLERYYQAHAQVLSAQASAVEGDVRQRLHQLLDRYLDFVEDHQRQLSLVQRELREGSEALELIAKGMQLLHDRLAQVLEGLVPRSGALSSAQFFVSFSGLVRTYYLDAPALHTLWEGDPLSAQNRRERREHLHWLAEAILHRLQGPG